MTLRSKQLGCIASDRNIKILVLVIFLYLSISKITLDKTDCIATETNQPHHIELSQSKTDQIRVLILSQARSGSSFLGDLLQQEKSTYYSFEPLISVRRHSNQYSSLIYHIFDCNFEKLRKSLLKPMFWNVQYMRWNAILRKTVSFKADGDDNAIHLFNYSLHQSLCLSSRVILIKTIRFTLDDFWQTYSLHVHGPQVRVVLLVRDPRPVMNSRLKLPWCYQTANCTDSTALCNRMRHNLATLRQMSNSSISTNIFLLRYEDLVGNIMQTTQNLFKFLGFKNPGTNLSRWIESHTSRDDALHNPHSTYRDRKTVLSKWQTELSSDEVIAIQQDCIDVMRDLGYVPIDLDTNFTFDWTTHRNLVQSKYPMQAYVAA